MKNWLPFVFGPELAMDSIPGLLCFNGIKFVLEVVTWPTGSSAAGTTSLNHELLDYPMKFETIVKALIGKVDKIGHRHRGLVGKKFQVDFALVGLDCCLHFIFSSVESIDKTPVNIRFP